MNDEQMRASPRSSGKLGFVFNFITYGGHQIDGLAGEEFATALREDGMLALARLQRKFRLLESPYRTPQTLVGGPRADAALMALSGRTATTKAMGKGSTQFQHQVQTEVPPKLLEEWLEAWGEATRHRGRSSASRCGRTARARELLELAVLTAGGEKAANVVFDTIQDRRGRSILSIRDQNTFDAALRRKRLMTLLQLFLIHRYKIVGALPSARPRTTATRRERMKARGLFSAVQRRGRADHRRGGERRGSKDLARSGPKAPLNALIERTYPAAVQAETAASNSSGE